MITLGDENLHLVKIVGSSCAAAVVGYIVWKRVTKPKKKEYPRDTVILHNIGRGPYIPSLTPFTMKLETYLRFANIKYINVHDMQTSKKKKFTWIEYNGEEIDDSEFCIEYLNKKYGVDLSIIRVFHQGIEEQLEHSRKCWKKILIGENKFILGDAPCQEDCAIFGILAAVYYQGFESKLQKQLQKYTNLCEYCERMKERFWPDWDQCITKGGTQIATH